jgi:hypothetical protein
MAHDLRRSTLDRCIAGAVHWFACAPVAQMDRAVASGATGRGFESLQAYQTFRFFMVRMSLDALHGQVLSGPLQSSSCLSTPTKGVQTRGFVQDEVFSFNSVVQCFKVYWYLKISA